MKSIVAYRLLLLVLVGNFFACAIKSILFPILYFHWTAPVVMKKALTTKDKKLRTDRYLQTMPSAVSDLISWGLPSTVYNPTPKRPWEQENLVVQPTDLALRSGYTIGYTACEFRPFSPKTKKP